MSIRIEEGKFYRTRAGAKVGPMTLAGTSGQLHCWLCTTTKEYWADNGVINLHKETPSDGDLIAEWADADEAASKELYPGVYAYVDTPFHTMVADAIPPMRVQILHEGARLTNGERDAEYGPPAVNMAAAGALKAAFRAHMTRDISLAELEAIDMALTKLGRIATGQKVKRDTFIDCAAYIAIAGEIALGAK